MPRQPKWVAAGIYQPTYQPRRAYGHRGRYPREMVDNCERQMGVIRAAEIARYGPALLSGGMAGLQLVSVPMPRGGVRWLLTCPRCKGTSTRLYERWHGGFRTFATACRKCWGLVYRSQYEGRRLEAHPDYLQSVTHRQIDRTPHEPRGYFPIPARRQIAMYTHARRMQRYDRLQTLLDRRTSRYIARRETASAISMLTLLARSERQEQNRWRRIVNQVLWHGHIDSLRDLAAMKSAPVWVRQVCAEALKQMQLNAESEVKPAKTARKVAKTLPKTDVLAQSPAILDASMLADLRARYAALGQGRRAKRAA